MRYKEFDCGCQFELNEQGGIKRFDINKIRLDCPKTWELFRKGWTRGLFQMETNLGRTYSKKLIPTWIPDLAAAGAILRPGTLETKDARGVNMTEHYCLRKNGLEEATVIHPALENILAETYQICIFQENLMRIAMEIAGFNLAETHRLIKATSKKNAAEMSAVKTMFIDRASKFGVVDEAGAKLIWANMEASVRYLFVKAHATAYGIIGYQTAYFKAHFPKAFLCEYLELAKEKQKPMIEKAELIEESKLMDVEVVPPDIRKGNIEFDIFDGKIYYGLGSVKGIGPVQAEKIRALGNDWISRGWDYFLIMKSDLISSTAVERMIETGELRVYEKQRQQLLHEYSIWSEILKSETKTQFAKEQFVAGKVKTLEEVVRTFLKLKKDGGGAHSVKDIDKFTKLLNSLLNPPFKNVDNVDWIIWCEREYLGTPLTCSSMDNYDLTRATCTCKEYLNGYRGYVVLGAEVVRIKEQPISRGQHKGEMMAFATLRDGTATMDNCVIFSEQWKEFKDIMAVGKTMLFQGERSKKDSFQIQKVSEID